jgi:hypothetical protein
MAGQYNCSSDTEGHSGGLQEEKNNKSKLTVK